jgi:nucleotide-binding universal stress UspA family protein
MHRFKNILYVADGPPPQRKGLDRAVAVARANQARLTVLDVTEEVSVDWDPQRLRGPRLTEALVERRLCELEALTAPYEDAGVTIYTQVLTGTPFVEVIRQVQRDGHDLLIKAPRAGKGLTDQALGSSDMHLLRKCPCPVWIDHPRIAHPYRTLLAAVDPTDPQAGELNRLILDLATTLAAREQAALHVVHVWRLHGEALLRGGWAGLDSADLEALFAGTEQGHRDALNRVLAPYGMTAADPKVHLVKGEAARVIGALAEDLGADLILMGTLGRIDVPGLFIGSTAEDVLSTTRSSVLALKPPGFASPVGVT